MKESVYLEFKREISNTFLKTVSAFANFHDGQILFGVDDSGNRCGLQDTAAARIAIENKINDSISPKPDFSIEEDGDILCLSIKKSDFPPYLYKGKAYRRNDTSDIEIDRRELERLILEASHLSFEELPSKIQNLKFSSLGEKLKEVLGVRKISNDVLRTLGLLSAEKGYNNAAAICSDENEFYGVDMARFGKDINEIMDRETFSGKSVLEEYEQAVTFFRRYYAYEKIDGVERKKIELVPETAFREALANALIHRDWSVNSHVRVSMSESMIEINSPGGLPSGITQEEYLNGEISCLRNPIIGNIFFRLNYIEMFGTGIKRIRAAYKDAPRKPGFRITNSVISVSLPTLSAAFDLSPDEKRINEALRAGAKMSSRELVEATGFSKAKIIRLVNALQEKGYLRRSGEGRGIKYSL